MDRKIFSTSKAKKKKEGERAPLTAAEITMNDVADTAAGAGAAAVSTVTNSSSPTPAASTPSTTTTRTAGFTRMTPDRRSSDHPHDDDVRKIHISSSIISSPQARTGNPVEMGWKLGRIIDDLHITPAMVSQMVSTLISSLPTSPYPLAITVTQSNAPPRPGTTDATLTAEGDHNRGFDDDDEDAAIANEQHAANDDNTATTATMMMTTQARQQEEEEERSSSITPPDQHLILHLTRAISLAASHHGGNVPSQLASTAVAAGQRVWAANRGARLLSLVEQVELVELCRIPFLMHLIAGFFEDVCGIVLAEAAAAAAKGDEEEGGEADEACLQRVIAFELEVGDAIEERVGTEEFERCCRELGVWEESEDEDVGDEEGGGHVCGEECEDQSGKGGERGKGIVDDDDDDDTTGGEDCDDNTSDVCSNPFEENEDDGQAESPTTFWTTRAAPGEDHHTLFKRAMVEVNERLTFIEHVIGRGIRGVAMQCDGSPATHFYNFYIPATRSILSDLVEEKTREIARAREIPGRLERAVPNPTNLDPMRFHFLRLIFLGDHPELAATMQDKKLDKEHRRNTMHVFWQHAVIDQNLSEEELTEFCNRLRDQVMFDEISEYIPTLQMDQSHTEFLNPTVNRIMTATRDLRPPAPVAGQSRLEDHGFKSRKATATAPEQRQPTMPTTSGKRNMIAAEILNHLETRGLNDQIPTQKGMKDLIGMTSPEAFATIKDDAIKTVSGQAMEQSEVFIDGIYYAWTKGLINISSLRSLKDEGALRDFLTACGEEMSHEAAEFDDTTISLQQYLEMRDRGDFGLSPGNRVRKESNSKGKFTNSEGLAEAPVKKPSGVGDHPKSVPALPSKAQSKDSKANPVFNLDLLDLLIGLILRALGSDMYEILQAHDEARKRKSEAKAKASVPAHRDDEFSNKEISRLSALVTTLEGCVREYKGDHVNNADMMAAHAEMKAILEKMMAGPNKAEALRALERSHLLRLTNAKTPKEIVASFVTPVPESSLAGVKTGPNRLNKVAIPKIPIPREKRDQQNMNEEDLLLIDIRDIIREYHAAGLGFEHDSTMGLATERPLGFLEDFRKTRSEHLKQKLEDAKMGKKQQTENMVKGMKGTSKEEIAAHDHHKSELTRRMLKITNTMLPYFSSKRFNAQELSKHLMDAIEMLPTNDLMTACTIIDRNMPKALKADGKPSIANLKACADEFDVMMERMCDVVIPCKCKCKCQHVHGQSNGKQVKKGRR